MSSNVVISPKCLLVKLALLTAVASTSSLALGQQDATEANGFVADVELAFVNNSNVQRNAFGEGDNLVSLSPDIAYVNYFGKHMLSAEYAGEFVQYADLDNLNFNNHSANLALNFDHSLRVSSEFNLLYENGVEDPSLVNNLVQNFEVFTGIERSLFTGALLYGTEDSIGQVVLSVESSSADVTNNGQEFRSFDSVGGSAEFFYRIAPNTRAIIEISTYDFAYKDVESNFFDQSSIQNSYLAGIQWRASEQLNSSLRIGYQTKDFDDARLENINGLSFGLSVDWAPAEETAIIIRAARTANESSIIGVGGFVSTSADIGVEHELSERLSSFAEFRYATDDFDNRKDVSYQYSLGIEYDLRRWVSARLEYTVQDRDSDFSNFSYNAKLIQLAFRIILD